MTGKARRRRAFLAGLIASLGTWGAYLSLLWPKMLYERSDGLYTGGRSVWADWAHHFAYANVFAYRPPEAWLSIHPLFATKGLDYPFVADALSGLLMRTGLDRIAAFLLPSIVTSLVLGALLFSLYALLLRTPLRALLALSLFFTNGGLGFLKFLEDLAREPSLQLLRFPPHDYTHLTQYSIEWMNIVSAAILPQRGLLLGMTIALTVLVPMVRYSRRGFAGVSWFKLMGLGLLSSVLVITYMHAYVALVLLCAVLLAYDRRSYRPWLVFAASAAVPSVWLLFAIYADTSLGGFVTWYPGWIANPSESPSLPLWLLLWLNWGVFLPIAAVSFVRFRYHRDPLIVGGAVLFVLCFLVRFQPLVWDNNKILTWAHLLLCVPVAHYLAHLWAKRRWLPRVVAATLVIFTTASGSLELWRLTRTEELGARMWSNDEFALAEAFQAISRPTAIVLCSDHHHQWVPSLSGRPVLLGYRGWLHAWGIDYSEVERDVRSMLGGGTNTEALLERYGVEFVVIGPTERRDYGANDAYWMAHHELVLEGVGYRVFRVTRVSESQRGD